MTELIMRTLAPRTGGPRARILAVALLALAAAAATGAWLAVIDRVQGVTHGGFPVTTAEAVRDAALSLPLMLGAAWLAVALSGRLVRAAGIAGRAGLCAGVLALVAAALTGIAGGLHSLAAGAVVGAAGGSFELGTAELLAQRVLLAVPAALVASGLVALLLLNAQPWTAPVARIRRRLSMARVVMGAGAIGAAVLTALAVAAGTVAGTASAVSGPGQPCPNGAPVRDYQVKAINVNIPLNRFGDRDPLGVMYVLTHFGSPAAQRAVGDGQAPTYVATGQEAAVRVQEANRHVSIGLRDDPIQPLVIRANVGECVEIAFLNDANGGDVGIHIDGLAYEVGSSGDAVGANQSSTATRGDTVPVVYRYYIPDDPDMEGTKYIRPGPGMRALVNHGLFGALVAEPKGSTWYAPYEEDFLDSGWGWEARIDPPGPAKSFREHVKLFHEIGNENEDVISGATGVGFPQIAPVSHSYRPGARAINYRSEPFENRLVREDRGKSLAYNSFTFGDPATPMPRSYLGDPTKIRIVHAGSEMLHVYHLHGGGIRWRFNPQADKTFDYQDTGLRKHPVAETSDSQRLDSQSQAPGETYELEIEGGAGGVQQSAGDFLFHCHIASHYVSGMWSFWRTYDTKQGDLAELPDRQNVMPTAVDSTQLIGRNFNGVTLTKDNLADWVEPQLPPPGVPRNWDAAVWDWDKTAVSGNPLYLGAPEDTSGWANNTRPADVVRPWAPFGSTVPYAEAGHPGLHLGDTAVGAQNRPKILFNPLNGRPAYPLLRNQIGVRAPFSGNGHSGAPWTGEKGGQAPTTAPGVPDPWAGRNDAMCPSDGIDKKFNLVSIDTAVQVTSKGGTDPAGKLFTLAKNKDKVRNGQMPKEPLFVRLNIGDCGFVSLVSEQPDDAEQPFSMTNAHIHHVQFDVQASDGVGTGLAFGQAVRPYQIEDTQLAAAAAAGTTTVELKRSVPGLPNGENASTFDEGKIRPGVWIGVGQGLESIEARQIASVTTNATTLTVTLTKPLANAHAADEFAGTEFVRYLWYPDVALDNIFWHDHVDGLNNWAHGLVSQLIIEPRGSTYHDPKTGQPVDSGSVVDIRTSNPLIPGVIDGSFREFALLTIDNNVAAGANSTLNLRAEPLDQRTGPGGASTDESLALSSYTHGDPFTPIPRAYVGDPFVIRTINVGDVPDSLTIDGHNFKVDTRMPGASPQNSFVYGVSERFTLALGNGRLSQAGDFLYKNAAGNRFRQGAWGIIRVLDRQTPDLQPLPGTSVPAGPAVLPPVTGGRPPDAGNNPGTPCPTGARTRRFDVSAVEVPGIAPSISETYVLSSEAAVVRSGQKAPDPLVMHVAEGECLEVNLKNEMGRRVSMNVAELEKSVRSSGVNVGFNVEQTVAPGATRLYRFYAPDQKVGAAVITDHGARGTGPNGMYGAVVVHPAGSVFRDPVTGAYRDSGVNVDVKPGSGAAYRDMTLIFSANDDIIGQNSMPYPVDVAAGEAATFVNFRRADQAMTDTPATFALANPGTGVLKAVAGDRTRIHAIGAPGNDQVSAFSAGGHAWRRDPNVPRSEILSVDRIGAETIVDAELIGGAGGPAKAVGDHFVGDLRRPFTKTGMWTILRVLPPGAPDVLSLAAPFPAGPADPVVAVPAATPTPRISRLVVPKKATLQSVLKNGIRLRLTGPADLGTLTVKMHRGKKQLVSNVLRQTAKTVKPLRGKVRNSLTVNAAGTVAVTWKVPTRVVTKLKPGKHKVSVVWRGQTLGGFITLTDASKAKATKATKKPKPKAKKK